MKIQIQSRLVSCPFKDIQVNRPLSSMTTLELGGPAKLLIYLTSIQQALDVFNWLRTESLPFHVLGGGSNLICADQGFDGVIVQFKMKEMTFTPLPPTSTQKKKGEVYVESGVDWSTCVSNCVDQGWAGIECLAGIPGHVGAAPIQNIGAYGASLSDVCTQVLVYDFIANELRWWTAEECKWRYRWSHFKAVPNRYIIFALKLTLDLASIPPIRYKQLETALSSVPTQKRTLRTIYESVLELRRSKSMVWDPNDPNHRSAGSFFLNPFCTIKEFQDLQERVNAIDPTLSIPHWSEGDRIKVPAAWLIEHAGCPKGFGQGRVGLSSKHTLALINRGGATTEELLLFSALIQEKVRKKFRIILEREPNLWQYTL